MDIDRIAVKYKYSKPQTMATFQKKGIHMQSFIYTSVNVFVIVYTINIY